MPKGGDLYIRTQKEMLTSNRTSPYEAEPGSYIKISITDTGIGMDEATRKRIFEPFFRPRKKIAEQALALRPLTVLLKITMDLLRSTAKRDRERHLIYFFRHHQKPQNRKCL